MSFIETRHGMRLLVLGSACQDVPPSCVRSIVALLSMRDAMIIVWLSLMISSLPTLASPAACCLAICALSHAVNVFPESVLLLKQPVLRVWLLPVVSHSVGDVGSAANPQFPCKQSCANGGSRIASPQSLQLAPKLVLVSR